jgi:hypothetical protein
MGNKTGGTVFGEAVCAGQEFYCSHVAIKFIPDHRPDLWPPPTPAGG